MATILAAWELGGGLGHLASLAALTRPLAERGHRIVLAVRDLSRAKAVFGDLPVTLFQTPVKTSPSPDRIDPLRSYAHILHNSGYSDAAELAGLVAAWRNLIELARVDLVLCDHAPTALIAARCAGVPAVATGTGFCCPPDEYPLPGFRPAESDAVRQLCEAEDRVLDNINAVLSDHGAQLLERLGQIFSRASGVLLHTFAELDHYPQRVAGRYWGAWYVPNGEPPVWPDSRGLRIFAYLSRHAPVSAVCQVFAELRWPALVYIDRADVALQRRYAGTNVRLVAQRVDLAAAAAGCDVAVLHGGHGTTAAMLLSGKPVVILPLSLEQSLTGLNVTRLGAGCVLRVDDPERLRSVLGSWSAGCPFSEAARAFAARYGSFSASKSGSEAGSELERLLDGKI